MEEFRDYLPRPPGRHVARRDASREVKRALYLGPPSQGAEAELIKCAFESIFGVGVKRGFKLKQLAGSPPHIVGDPSNVVRCIQPGCLSSMGH